MTSNKRPNIILASQSPYRSQLLQRLGLPFDVAPAHIDETPKENEAPEDLSLRLASQKARTIAQRQPEALVIGSDQVAEVAGQPLGKPGTEARALEQLMMASGKTATFHTALSVQRGHFQREAVVPYSVHFRPFSEAEAQRYIQKEKPLDCAGSFKAEGLGISLFLAQSGEDPNALIGLPLIKLCEYLREYGYQIP